MTLKTNIFAQIVALAAQALNQYGSLIPLQAQPIVALGLGVAQLVVGFLAHFSNTNGTPQEAPGGSAAPPKA